MILNIFKEVSDGERAVESLKEFEGIYPDSINKIDDSLFFLAKIDGNKSLVILGKSKIADRFYGENILAGKGLICPLNNYNSNVLREVFPFTAPRAYKSFPITIGLGDRLGLASPGHLKLTKEYKFFPVIAQQSIRELKLTNRTFLDVLDSASWAAFQEGYMDGFGFDGDHLKTDEEIELALDSGATMLTLDCSEYINNDIFQMDKEEIKEKYLTLDEIIRNNLEEKYLNKNIQIDESLTINMDLNEFMKLVLIYLDGINYAIHVFNKFVSPKLDEIDFEISIDETLHTTSISAHYFVASMLRDNNVKIRSLAPRFCGEFQKGIDYIGDINEFENEFKEHFKLSKYFGYKLSIHSGSDKFSVFPIIGKVTNGYYHLKTAGTNWLEAIRVIAKKDPIFFREIYKFAVDNLDEAKKYYHVSVTKNDAVDIEYKLDANLDELMDDNNIRQIIHITYGLILQGKDKDDNYIFRDRLFNLLNENEEEYYSVLQSHIGKHLKLLNV